MRRKEREVSSRAAIHEIIESCDCCRIALWDGEKPYIVPLNFGWEEQEGRLLFYFHCAGKGKKLTLLRQYPSVGFELDTGHALQSADKAENYTFCYRSIIGSGTLCELLQPEEKRHALNLLMQHYTGRAEWEMTGCMQCTTVLCLKVEELTAKQHI